MYAKLFIIFVGLAFAAAASVPSQRPVGEQRQAFETEEAIYIPISSDEAHHLRLPRIVDTLNALVFDPIVELENAEKTERVRRSAENSGELNLPWEKVHLPQVRPREPYYPQGQYPNEKQSFDTGSHHRTRRDVSRIIETEDAFYLPVSDEEVVSLRLPRQVDNGNEEGSEVFYIPDEFEH